MSIPVLSNYFPKQADSGMAHTLKLLGGNFNSLSKVFLNNIETPYTLVSSEEIDVPLAASQPFGEYLVRVQNRDENEVDRLESSGEVSFRLLANESDTLFPDYPEEPQDQRRQPLAPSLRGRLDAQRIIAGQNFDGELPDEEQGKWGDLTGPSTGGVWRFTEKVALTQFEFVANLPEAGAGRTAGSGLFLRQKDGAEVKIINLSNTPDPDKGTTNHAFFTGLDLDVEEGEALVFKTFGATREMRATIKTRTDRPVLGRAR